MVEVLKSKTSEMQLRKVGLLILEKRLRGDLIADCNFMMRGNRDLSLVPVDRT